MIKAVLDTNVLASGLLKAGSPPGALLELWTGGQFELVLSEHIFEELTRTLAKPYFRNQLSEQAANRQIFRIRENCLLVPHLTSIRGIASHSEDDTVLSVAVSGQAEFLVTGDKEFLAVERFRDVTILTPANFLSILTGSRPEPIR